MISLQSLLFLPLDLYFSFTVQYWPIYDLYFSLTKGYIVADISVNYTCPMCITRGTYTCRIWYRVTYTFPTWYKVTYTCPTWYRVLILVPRVHVVYLSSLSQVVNYQRTRLHLLSGSEGRGLLGSVVTPAQTEESVCIIPYDSVRLTMGNLKLIKIILLLIFSNFSAVAG